MLSIHNQDKSDKILIRCSADLKRAIRVAAAQKDASIEDLCADLLSKGLGIPEPEPRKRKTA